MHYCDTQKDLYIKCWVLTASFVNRLLSIGAAFEILNSDRPQCDNFQKLQGEAADRCSPWTLVALVALEPVLQDLLLLVVLTIMLAICLFLQYSTVWKCSTCLKWSCVSQHVCWAVLTSCVARMTETSRSVCNFSWEGAIARETTDRCFSSTLPACCPLPQQYCSQVLYNCYI